MRFMILLDPVFCCNFDKSGTLAVSGGQDDKAFVWDVNTGETKFVISGMLINNIITIV